MKQGDLVYVDYITKREYYVVISSTFTVGAGMNYLKLLNTRTGEIISEWEYCVQFICES